MKQTKPTRPAPYGVRLGKTHKELLKRKAKKDKQTLHAFILNHLIKIAEA